MTALDASSFPTSVMAPSVVEQLTDRIVAAAQDALGEQLMAVIVKGSAITGDFYPYFSDFDVHAYVADSVLRGPRTLRPEFAFRFQANIAELEPLDYGVSQVQVFFLSSEKHPDDWTPPMPNSYRAVYGDVPAHLHRVDEGAMLLKARSDLQGLRLRADSLLESMVDKPDSRLAPSVRLTGTFLKPGLRQAAMLLGAPPVEVWGWPLHRVLDRVEPEVLPAQEATAFFECAARWPQVGADGPSLRAMAALGITALDALAEFGHKQG